MKMAKATMIKVMIVLINDPYAIATSAIPSPAPSADSGRGKQDIVDRSKNFLNISCTATVESVGNVVQEGSVIK